MTQTPSAQSVPSAALATGFVALFAGLLALFPARNADLWRSLADGRDGRFGPTWVYDTGNFCAWLAAGGGGVVGLKAVTVALAAVLMLWVSRTAGWLLPAACVALAVLAMGGRLLAQPATYSVAFLAGTVWLLFRVPGLTSRWPLVLLFLVWANTDRWFVAGLGVVALTWLGRGFTRRDLVTLAILIGVCLLNPGHRAGFPLPPELLLPGSPFERAFLSAALDSPAALAYYPLLGLGLLSFLLNPLAGRWDRLLPWLGLAVLSGVQVRTVPLFAVMGGPVLAWNLADFFARRPTPTKRERTAAAIGAGLAVVLLLVAAWPGWLQRPPYEPRRWAADPPTAAGEAAEAVRQLSVGGRTLHLSPDTAAGFAWFAPNDPGGFDPALAESLLTAENPDPDRLRAAGVGRVVVSAADRGAAVLDRLLAAPSRWPVLHLSGGVLVVGTDPAAGQKAIDFERYRVPNDVAPDERTTSPAGRWWSAFVTPAPARSPDRDQAAVLLRKADALRRTAPFGHLLAWEASQAAGLLGAVGPADATLRLSLLRPPLPADSFPADPPPITRLAVGIQQRFARDRGDTPLELLYAAVRAGRRAAAADPTDPAAQLTLGRAYVRLLDASAERGWADRLPELGRLRSVQAAAALRRATVLDPGLADARLAYGRFLQQTGALDLALDELRAYRSARHPRGGPDPTTVVPDAELAALEKQVESARREWEAETPRGRPADRASAAAGRGLIGTGLRVLLESDVSAFGSAGTRLELDFLLRVGRPDEVLDWATDEVRASLGPAEFDWVRGQARAAVGDYAAADEELRKATDSRGRAADPARLPAALGGLIGAALLDTFPADHPSLPRLLWRAARQADAVNGLQSAIKSRSDRADVACIRGLLAAEAGRTDRAEAAFREVDAVGRPEPVHKAIRSADLGR